MTGSHSLSRNTLKTSYRAATRIAAAISDAAAGNAGPSNRAALYEPRAAATRTVAGCDKRWASASSSAHIARPSLAACAPGSRPNIAAPTIAPTAAATNSFAPFRMPTGWPIAVPSASHRADVKVMLEGVTQC